MDNSEITHLEWCAGYGGIHLGLSRVVPNLRLIALSEIEAYACANLVSKMESGRLAAAPVWTNLKTFPCEQFRGLVDIFSAGYPCQPFSACGKRKGADDPRHLWPFIQRAVGIIRPRCCFFENVEGHLTLGFKDVCHDLDELDYVVTAGLFSAAEVGASQQRKRLFIMAHSKDFDGRLQLQPRRSLGSCSESGGSSEGMADTEPSERWTEHQEHGEAHGRAGPGWSGSNLADPSRERHGGLALTSGEQHGQGANRASECGQGVAAVGLADGCHEGLQGLITDWLPRSNERSTGRGSRANLPAYPPGPSDREGWRRVLEIEPSLEPALCRVADGNTYRLDALRHRIDRLRLCGNGVVPDTAAKAFVTLWNELTS